MQWIAREHPQLAGKYRRLYGTGSYASKEYRAWLAGRVRYFKDLHGFSGSQGFSHRDLEGGTDHDDARQEEAQYPTGSIPDKAGHASPRHSGHSSTGHSSIGPSKADGSRTDHPSAAQPTLF